MKFSSSLILFFAATLAMCQNEPVTVAEVNAVINKVDFAMRKAMSLKPGSQLPTTESRIATKAEIIKALDKLFEVYRPKFQYTPRPFRLEKEIVEQFNTDPSARTALVKFIKFGCVGTVSPLVVGPSSGMTPNDFGDAIGFFAAQIAALTYFADPLYVPNIQRNDQKEG